MRSRLIGAAVVAMLTLPAFAWAHEGHDHTVMRYGAFHRRQEPDGEDDRRQDRHGDDGREDQGDGGDLKLDLSAIKVGDRVVAAGPEEKEMIMAETVKVVPARPREANGGEAGCPK
jgi:hypothetical protein